MRLRIGDADVFTAMLEGSNILDPAIAEFLRGERRGAPPARETTAGH